MIRKPAIFGIEDDLKRTRDTIQRGYIDVNRINQGHEQAVLDILSNADKADLSKMNSLYIKIDRLRTHSNPMMVPQNGKIDVNAVVADSRAKLPVALEEYNSIIDRIGLRPHLKD